MLKAARVAAGLQTAGRFGSTVTLMLYRQIFGLDYIKILSTDTADLVRAAGQRADLDPGIYWPAIIW
jgi:hypothetical protein